MRRIIFTIGDLVLIAMFLSDGQAMLFGGQCDLSPDFTKDSDPDIPSGEIQIVVPEQCTNGTFRWNYPGGQTNLYFTNFGRPAAACFQELLGGDIFNITDITDGHGHTKLPRLHRNSEAVVCTNSSTIPLVIQVSARPHMYYLGEFSFMIKFP
ncbi:uncharacterized protein LOC127841858 [Dreissena polymorpha]|uniref:Uncharacterized protein n=1 Tax=Dreissena polymorpha TaxID=45954 RepID=A0A9D4EWX2_DREPO|nr:uncharacterized protein LOC127841858 [Dreissena polymorpha]KAH3787707.1 hypothetical protein DPMN_165834 [Dreissena polymorpha]